MSSVKKLVLFDCDGVLVDSELLSSQIGVELYSQYGITMSVEESLRKFTGLSAQSIDKILRQESADSGREIPQNLMKMKQNIFMQEIEMKLKPLMEPVLKFLKSEKEVSRCVASSSLRDRVLKSLEVTKLMQYFEEDWVFTSQQVKNGKPAPDLFLFAALSMGIMSQDSCLVIEDSVAGIRAAKAAKMKVVAFLGGSHAKFDWYEERIKKENVPIARNTTELLVFVKKFLSDDF